MLLWHSLGIFQVLFRYHLLLSLKVLHMGLLWTHWRNHLWHCLSCCLRMAFPLWTLGAFGLRCLNYCLFHILNVSYTFSEYYTQQVIKLIAILFLGPLKDESHSASTSKAASPDCLLKGVTFSADLGNATVQNKSSFLRIKKINN